MKLKRDDAGNVVVQDDKPVYVGDDGKDVVFDAIGTIGTISRLNGEAKGHRERAEKAEAANKAFEGIDAETARKAIDAVKGLKEADLIKAGDRDKAVQEAIKAVEDRFAPVVKENEGLKGALYGEKIGGAFSRSKFIADKLAIPFDFAQARFEKHFKIEDGKTVAYDAAGNKIFSKARPGEVADFDEALETLVDQYPSKDHILKGSGASGSGAGGGTGGGGGAKTITRAQIEALAPAERGAAMKGKTLVD